MRVLGRWALQRARNLPKLHDLAGRSLIISKVKLTHLPWASGTVHPQHNILAEEERLDPSCRDPAKAAPASAIDCRDDVALPRSPAPFRPLAHSVREEAGRRDRFKLVGGTTGQQVREMVVVRVRPKRGQLGALDSRASDCAGERVLML